MAINNKYYPNSVWLIDNQDKIEITRGGTVYQQFKDENNNKFMNNIELRKLVSVESRDNKSIAIKLLSGKQIVLVFDGISLTSNDCVIRRLDKTVKVI